MEVQIDIAVASATVLAAVVAAGAAFVGLVIAKEQKISEFRQQWIDALRSEIAEFAAHARRIGATPWPISRTQQLDPRLTPMDQWEAAHNEDAMRVDPLLENRVRLRHTYHSIMMRLNDNDREDRELRDSVIAVMSALGAREDTEAVLDAMSDRARSLLKREWERVKTGENGHVRALRIARITMNSATIGAGMVIAYAVLRFAH
jgi:hypothetical protein